MFCIFELGALDLNWKSIGKSFGIGEEADRAEPR
jgi:hypothetical protein